MDSLLLLLKRKNICAGKIFAETLHYSEVFCLQDLLDRRYDVKTTDEMFAAICDHLKHATNGGTIRSTITVFRQVRVPYKNDEELLMKQTP